MGIYTHQGMLSAADYAEVCRHKGIDPSETVFLFPGNRSHHAPGITLFSPKTGGGLARVAHDLGKLNYATLSLPTTTMEHWANDTNQQSVVQQAIEDLYRAAAAGFDFLLPARRHQNTRYFDEALAFEGGQLEPSFWGGIQASPNKPLANHYTQALNDLNAFLLLDDEERLANARENLNSPFMEAYLQGLKEASFSSYNHYHDEQSTAHPGLRDDAQQGQYKKSHGSRNKKKSLGSDPMRDPRNAKATSEELLSSTNDFLHDHSDAFHALSIAMVAVGLAIAIASLALFALGAAFMPVVVTTAVGAAGLGVAAAGFGLFKHTQPKEEEPTLTGDLYKEDSTQPS
jgi:hypothetical protein